MGCGASTEAEDPRAVQQRLAAREAQLQQMQAQLAAQQAQVHAQQQQLHMQAQAQGGGGGGGYGDPGPLVAGGPAPGPGYPQKPAMMAAPQGVVMGQAVGAPPQFVDQFGRPIAVDAYGRPDIARHQAVYGGAHPPMMAGAPMMGPGGYPYQQRSGVSTGVAVAGGVVGGMLIGDMLFGGSDGGFDGGFD